MTLTVNLPDVLGYVSGDERLDLGVIQAAATCLPSAVKAGKNFRLVVIVQNMADVPVNMLVTLGLPADAAGKKNKFSANTQRIEVGMQPAEVGMILLPINSMGDTAPGEVKFSVSISDVKATARGGRIRSSEGGSALYLDGLRPEKRKLVDNFAKQKFVGGKKGLFGGATLMPPMTFQAGRVSEPSNLKAEYHTIWLREDMREDPLKLLDRFKTTLTQYVLTSLDRTLMLAPLVKKTATRFKQAGYELTDVEAKLIGRAMTNVLEYACTGRLSHGRSYTPRQEYQVLPIIERPIRVKFEIKLRWLIELLNALVIDVQLPKNVWRLALQDSFYDALLRDTLTWGLNIVEEATGLDLGMPEELEQHADQWFEKFHKMVNGRPGAEALTIEDVYLPLVMAGIAVYDKLALPGEDIKVFNPLFRGMLGKRASERTDDNSPLFDITETMLSKILGDDKIITARPSTAEQSAQPQSQAQSNTRTYHISPSKVKTREADIKAIRDFFDRPVSQMWVYDPYLLDYERLFNRLGAYIQLAFDRGGLKSVHVQTRDAQIARKDRDAQVAEKDREEQLQAVAALENRFQSIKLEVNYPKDGKGQHDRFIEITRVDGSTARLLIGRGLDFIRADGSVQQTYLVIEEL